MTRLAYLVRLAAKSAWNRRGTLVLVVLSIALSSALLVGIERVRTQTRSSFVQAISGTDLVVGARGSGLQLMLYAVFHMGGATNNMGWDSARRIAERDDVAWTIPLSLGDSHRGFPVVATTADFFSRYRYRSDAGLRFAQGQPFDALFEVVVGSEVAAKAGYAPRTRLTLSHGSGGALLREHADKPFAVSGVLAPTGTPVDRSLYISLQAMEAVHLDWRGGAPLPGLVIRPEQVTRFDLTPKSVTAVLVGLKNRGRVFAAQREINAFPNEALTAVLPGVALDQLWSMLDAGEKALTVISWLVTVSGLAGLVSVMLAGLGERRRELAVLRAAGASPVDILVLLAVEGLLLVLTGAALGTAALMGGIAGLSSMLADSYGVVLSASWPDRTEWLILGAVASVGLLASLIPALRAYRLSLGDGLGVSL